MAAAKFKRQSHRGRTADCLRKKSIARGIGHCVETLETRTHFTAFTVTSAVDSTASGTLRWAIGQANAQANSVINFQAGFQATIYLAASLGPLDITRAVQVNGPGAGNAIVNGQSNSTVLEVSATATISGLAFTQGKNKKSGGGIEVSGDLTMNSCTISGNTSAGAGGGIYVSDSGELALNNCTISGNTATGAGGGVYLSQYSSLTANNCTITGNHAYTNGGGIYSDSTLTLSNCTISDNIAAGNGGGIYGYNAEPSVGVGSLIITVDNSAVSNNQATKGGGLYSVACDVNLQESTVSGNTDNTGGGGIYNQTLNDILIIREF